MFVFQRVFGELEQNQLDITLSSVEQLKTYFILKLNEVFWITAFSWLNSQALYFTRTFTKMHYYHMRIEQTFAVILKIQIISFCNSYHKNIMA